MIDDPTLSQLERQYAAGLTSVEILDVFASHDVSLSEATLRKYVQLGLLPRSVRVGRKGKHQGSQGMYPVAVIRQILRIKEMMAANLTIDEIQKEFLFSRSDLDDAERALGKAIDGLEKAAEEKTTEPTTHALHKEIDVARDMSRSLVDKLTDIEQQIAGQAKRRLQAM